MDEAEEASMSINEPTAKSSMTVRHKEQRYPYCIVWTPLPPITWLVPFIGHMGIATSAGIIYDFAGPYTIGVDHFAFGRPTRYLQLDPSKCQKDSWDTGVRKGSAEYEKRMHNLCCDNCHSHVAKCLNAMSYGGFKAYNMVILCFWLFFSANYVGVGGVVKTWLPFGIVLMISLLVAYL